MAMHLPQSHNPKQDQLVAAQTVSSETAWPAAHAEGHCSICKIHTPARAASDKDQTKQCIRTRLPPTFWRPARAPRSRPRCAASQSPGVPSPPADREHEKVQTERRFRIRRLRPQLGDAAPQARVAALNTSNNAIQPKNLLDKYRLTSSRSSVMRRDRRPISAWHSCRVG